MPVTNLRLDGKLLTKNIKDVLKVCVQTLGNVIVSNQWDSHSLHPMRLCISLEIGVHFQIYNEKLLPVTSILFLVALPSRWWGSHRTHGEKTPRRFLNVLMFLEAEMKVRARCSAEHPERGGFSSSSAYPSPTLTPSWATVCNSQGWVSPSLHWVKHHVHLLFSLHHTSSPHPQS